jgi:hypothetical protein
VFGHGIANLASESGDASRHRPALAPDVVAEPHRDHGNGEREQDDADHHDPRHALARIGLRRFPGTTGRNRVAADARRARLSQLDGRAAKVRTLDHAHASTRRGLLSRYLRAAYSTPPGPKSAEIAAREDGLAHLRCDAVLDPVRALAPKAAQLASVALVGPQRRRDNLERSAIEVLLKRHRGLFSKARFFRAAGVHLGGIDPDDADFPLTCRCR